MLLMKSQLLTYPLEAKNKSKNLKMFHHVELKMNENNVPSRNSQTKFHEKKPKK